MFVYILLSLLLECLHAFKVAFCSNIANTCRCLMWRLARSHGMLIGALNLLSAHVIERSTLSESMFRTASLSSSAAGVLTPLGFVVVDIVMYGGDRGLPIVLAPVGGDVVYPGAPHVLRFEFRDLARDFEMARSTTAARSLAPRPVGRCASSPFEVR